jgi:hypothetical protein
LLSFSCVGAKSPDLLKSEHAPPENRPFSAAC